jgi:hypothetical protein
MINSREPKVSNITIMGSKVMIFFEDDIYDNIKFTRDRFRAMCNWFFMREKELEEEESKLYEIPTRPTTTE